MADFIAPYATVVGAYTAVGLLFLLQTMVADVAMIRAGHVPGTPVGGGHDDFLFRAARAHANTNENLAFFLVTSLAAVLAGASSWWCGLLAWGFALSRLVHMVSYYGDVRLLRSAAFSTGLASCVGLLVVAIAALV